MEQLKLVSAPDIESVEHQANDFLKKNAEHVQVRGTDLTVSPLISGRQVYTLTILYEEIKEEFGTLRPYAPQVAPMGCFQ